MTKALIYNVSFLSCDKIRPKITHPALHSRCSLLVKTVVLYKIHFSASVFSCCSPPWAWRNVRNSTGANDFDALPLQMSSYVICAVTCRDTATSSHPSRPSKGHIMSSWLHNHEKAFLKDFSALLRRPGYTLQRNKTEEPLGVTRYKEWHLYTKKEVCSRVVQNSELK